jgi:hypothetical protein
MLELFAHLLRRSSKTIALYDIHQRIKVGGKVKTEAVRDLYYVALNDSVCVAILNKYGLKQLEWLELCEILTRWGADQAIGSKSIIALALCSPHTLEFLIQAHPLSKNRADYGAFCGRRIVAYFSNNETGPIPLPCIDEFELVICVHHIGEFGIENRVVRVGTEIPVDVYDQCRDRTTGHIYVASYLRQGKESKRHLSFDDFEALRKKSGFEMPG